MRDLRVAGKPATEDLSERMADNVVEALLGYMEEPSPIGAEYVHALSTALSSLSLLAIAESLRTLADALTEPVTVTTLTRFDEADGAL